MTDWFSWRTQCKIYLHICFKQHPGICTVILCTVYDSQWIYWLLGLSMHPVPKPLFGGGGYLLKCYIVNAKNWHNSNNWSPIIHSDAMQKFINRANGEENFYLIEYTENDHLPSAEAQAWIFQNRSISHSLLSLLSKSIYRRLLSWASQLLKAAFIMSGSKPGCNIVSCILFLV